MEQVLGGEGDSGPSAADLSEYDTKPATPTKEAKSAPTKAAPKLAEVDDEDGDVMSFFKKIAED